MDGFAMARLGNGQQVSYSYPYSHMMEGVCASVFKEVEYPFLSFLNARVILDVGANVGCTSILFAVNYPNATIYALEPAAEAYAYLQRNTAKYPNVRPFKIGAYDHDATTTLFLGKEASVTNSVTPNAFSGLRQEQIVLRRFTSFLREQSITHISLLKMDAEGVEIAILRDLAEMLDQVDAIMVEYHSETDRLTIDQMLRDRYTMYASSSPHPHRGSNTYVLKSILRSCTQFDSLAIAPPKIP
jgi:FkbM family methyltransferase